MNAASIKGDSVLMLAVAKSQSECIPLLVNAGADVNKPHPKMSITPLLVTAGNGDEKTLEELLKQERIDKNTRDDTGQDALMIAVTKGNKNCASRLIATGTDLNAVDHFGCTALMKAAVGGRLECVALLLESGADLKFRSQIGKTALIWAASRNQGRSLSFLINSGADVTKLKTMVSHPCYMPLRVERKVVCLS